MKTMIALLVGLAAASPLAAQDTIKFKDPKRNPDLEGDIVTLDFDLVEIELPAGNGVKVKQAVDPRLIQELIPKKSFDFTRGEEAMSNGAVATAIGRFERVVADTRATPALRQQAAIMIVRAQFSGGNYPAVVEASRSLRARKPDSFYLGESLYLEVKSLLATRDPDGAKGAIVTLAALGKARAIKEWVKNADLFDAHLAELQKNWRGALATYRKYARDADVGEEAALGELRCLTAIADFPGLSARADGILQDAQGKEKVSSRLLIAAYTGKADVDLNAGKLRAALFGYLQGAIALAKGETSPEHETSVARTALACIKVAAGSDPEEKAVYRSRGLEMLQELRRTYPSSRYRVEIEEALRGLR
jgi:outer membrane protein assembly factor BamD (BamD/ComL family)